MLRIIKSYKLIYTLIKWRPPAYNCKNNMMPGLLYTNNISVSGLIFGEADLKNGWKFKGLRKTGSIIIY